MRILVVDDEVLIRMELQDLLTSKGHEVVALARDGVEAIEQCQALRPDVVLMDIQMPKLTGIEAAKQMRHAQLAPVVLLTAYQEEELVTKAWESGVFGYLLKPVKEEQVVPALLMAVARFKDEQQLREEKKVLETTLEERKWIARATSILGAQKGISEEESYQRIRSYAMKKGMKVLAVCKAIVKESEKS